MRLGLIVFVLLLATAAVLFGPALIQGKREVDGPGGDKPANGPGAQPELVAPTPAPRGTDELPPEEPAPEVLPLERPLNVLVIMTRKGQRWARAMELALRADTQIKVSGFALEESQGAAPFGTGPIPAPGEPLTAAWFDAQSFDVVVLSDVDPNAFEPALWESVAGRVRAGTLGLWAQPGIPLPPLVGGGPAPDVHGLLTQPTLAALLPVEKATPIRGSPVPGVFAQEAPFALTAEGEKHVASRIVFWPQWSRRIWQLGAAAKPPWGTQFNYPVEALKPGSVVLVETRPAAGKPVPMYVQGPSASGRVLWFGAQSIADDTLRSSQQTAKWYALVHNAMVWLGGRAP